MYDPQMAIYVLLYKKDGYVSKISRYLDYEGEYAMDVEVKARDHEESREYTLNMHFDYSDGCSAHLDSSIYATGMQMELTW